MASGNKLKTAMITGGASGIGLGTALKLCDIGYQVITVDQQPLKDRHAKIDHYLCDIADPQALTQTCERIFARYEQVGYVFSNAGVHLSANLEATSIEEIDRLIDINLKGTLYTLKAILPHMREHRFGRIVFNSSEQALVGKPNSALYGLTKAAVAHLAKSTALDYAAFNIRANAICPGTIDTPLYQQAIARYCEKTGRAAAQVHKEEAALQPIGRLGTVSEVASLVAFLFSDEADFITGALLAIDGGYTAA